MENVWHLFNNTQNANGGRGQNGHSTTTPHHHAWEHGHSSHPYNFPHSATTATANATTNATRYFQEGALMFPHHHNDLPSSSSSNGSSYFPMDPHLTCLKLGKRHYFENANNHNNNNNTTNNNPNTNTDNNDLEAINLLQEPGVIKKVKNFIDGEEQVPGGGFGSCGGLIWQSPSPPATATAAPTMAPMCQVEGCNVTLVSAKDYHKRHKVCEMHSKAPKVIVLGIEQRFCQQCSRFHAICEFDESKRSCRRRLAGHNERRRKSSQDQPVPRKLTSDKMMVGAGGGCGYLPMLNPGVAHSLMSSNQYNFSPDLCAQSSAALRELMVENRAATAVLARHSWRNHHVEDQNVLHNHRGNYFPATEAACWEDMNAGAHLSLERRL